MRPELKYNWNSCSQNEREERIAKNVSQMVLFGSRVKDVKKNLKQLKSKNFLSNRKEFLSDSKFYNKKAQKKLQTFKFFSVVETNDGGNGT